MKDQSNYEILRELTAWLKPNQKNRGDLACQLLKTIPSVSGHIVSKPTLVDVLLPACCHALPQQK